MFDRLCLTHPCGEVVDLVAAAGVWTTARGSATTHCPGCRESLGSAFICAEKFHPRQLTDVRST